ncbi:MAG: hypothetical protein IJX67_02165 [Oscillospiraceae bacterium]|nr:hypothetical protein [Oscillospiraceae bacterium]
MKKILALCLCVAMLAIAIVGGTLAYFTDTHAETNTFTVGNIKIDLIENFEKDAELMPGIDVPKEVHISNTGDNAAYVWYEYLIPAALDSIDGTTGANNVLHVNAYGRTWDTYRENSKYWAEGQTAALPLEQTWDHDPDVELSELIGPQGFIGTETIEDIVYNKYVVLYHGIVNPDADTSIAMSNVYLDPKVDATVDAEGNVTYWLVENGVKTKIAFDLEETQIIVRAYGIQAEGFDDVYAAYTAYNFQY